jgi:hypothetical protein
LVWRDKCSTALLLPDLKILFKSNCAFKLTVDVSIINPAQFTSVASTLNCVIEREKNKNTTSMGKRVRESQRREIEKQ